MTNAEARFNKIHIRKVYACLAVTCHLHFWQNDRDFLRATVVTRGWNRYRNKSQHRKSTLEKKILPPFQQGFEPATFQSRVRCSNHWAIPAPLISLRHSLASWSATLIAAATNSHSEHRFPGPSSKEGCRKPVLGVCRQPVCMTSLSSADPRHDFDPFGSDEASLPPQMQ